METEEENVIQKLEDEIDKIKIAVDELDMNQDLQVSHHVIVHLLCCIKFQLHRNIYKCSVFVSQECIYNNHR